MRQVKRLKSIGQRVTQMLASELIRCPLIIPSLPFSQLPHFDLMPALKPLLFTIILALLPLAFGFWVNASATYPPSRDYAATRCTRYCEAYGCWHATAANSPAFTRLRPLYVATIQGLSVGGTGLYAALNIAFYVILIPGLFIWLTYGALRNSGRIRQQKLRARS